MSGQPVPSPIPPAKLAYSGSPFVIATGLETIPCDFPFVLLKNNTGNVIYMGGTNPAIAPGQYIGQRVITQIDPTGNAGVGFVITGPGLVQPIVSATVLNFYGGGYNESMEWVWNGSNWLNVSAAATNPLQNNLPPTANFNTVDVSGVATANLLSVGQALRSMGSVNWETSNVIGNPGIFTTNIPPGGATRLHIQGTNPIGDIVFQGTPFLNQPAPWPSEAFPMEGYFHTIYNEPLGFPFLVTFTFQDESLLAFSGFKLNTPKVTLLPGDRLHLQWIGSNGGFWQEIGRSLKQFGLQYDFTSQFDQPLDSHGAEIFNLNLDTIFSDNIAQANQFPTHLSPLNPGWVYDGKEMLIQNISTGAYNLHFSDEGTLANSRVRLTTATITLKPGDTLRLRYSVAKTAWCEVHRSILVP